MHRFKVKSRVGWKKKDYEVSIDNGIMLMIFKDSKGVPEILEKMNKDGLKAELANDKIIMRFFDGISDEDIIANAREELEKTAKAARWPVKFTFKEVSNEENSGTSG